MYDKIKKTSPKWVQKLTKYTFPMVKLDSHGFQDTFSKMVSLVSERHTNYHASPCGAHLCAIFIWLGRVKRQFSMNFLSGSRRVREDP